MTNTSMTTKPCGIFSGWVMRFILTVSVLFMLSTYPTHADVPGEVNYQGLLLDDLGAPVSGTSDFDFRIFDVSTGGSALWTESHTAVPVVDGIYSVALGSITPIPPSLLSGGSLHLEIAVDAETLSPRQRLLAVPYALRAEVAETTSTVGAIDSAFFEAILTAAPWDGSPPSNFDPTEGLVDTDGDGLPNFMDPDNDGDGALDSEEDLADINLTTPTIGSVVPTSVSEDLASTVTIFGTNFDPSMTVQVGSEIRAVSSVTPTSADVSIGANPAGPPEDIVVTLTNGQSATLVDALVVEGERFMFVTSTTHTGDISGIAGADAICNTRAAAGGLTGAYQAWLSDGVESPSTRSFQLYSGSYLTTTGDPIATSWSTLIDGTLDSAIDKDENGSPHASVFAWTNVSSVGAGAATVNHCSAWTSAFANGSIGSIGNLASQWTEAGVSSCTDPKPLYCIEQ